MSDFSILFFAIFISFNSFASSTYNNFFSFLRSFRLRSFLQKIAHFFRQFLSFQICCLLHVKFSLYFSSSRFKENALVLGWCKTYSSSLPASNASKILSMTFSLSMRDLLNRMVLFNIFLGEKLNLPLNKISSFLQQFVALSFSFSYADG